MSKVTGFFGKEQTHTHPISRASARGSAPGPRPRYVKAMTSAKSPLELAALATAAVHIWKKNNMLSIVGGTILYMVLVQAVFV